MKKSGRYPERSPTESEPSDATTRSAVLSRPLEDKTEKHTDHQGAGPYATNVQSSEQGSVYSIEDVVRQTVSNIESLYQNPDDYSGITSGFDTIDNITSGFHKGEFIVVGARP